HLVLATQRPSGSVNDAIRANTNVRISLRVQDAADSVDVVGTAAAAGIGHRQPGRALVRLGSGDVVPVQTAFVTGSTALRRAPTVGVRPFVFGPDLDRPPARANDRRPPGGTSDLARLVDAAVEGRRRSGAPPPRRPWPAPLPDRVTLEDLRSPNAIALVDEPSAQRQAVLSWSPADGHLLLYGVAGSGTTTALATIAVSLARALRPERVHMFVLDFGTQMLSPLAELPHVGAVVAACERERQ